MSNQLLLRRRMMQSKKDNILTFTAAAANSSVQLTTVGTPTAITLEYKLNNGGWLPYTIEDVISLPNIRDKVKLRGVNRTISTNTTNYYKFIMTGSLYASGFVSSLIDGIGKYIPTTLSNNVYIPNLFRDCISLLSAPNIGLEHLAYRALQSIFNGCSNIDKIVIDNTSIYSYCYDYAFYGCSNLKYIEMNILNSADNMCYGCSSCESFVIYQNTPATITNSTISGLKSDCKIYVPYSEDHSVLNAYKTKQYWNNRANYIFELDENGKIPS